MAATNKIVYGTRTLIDLTSDTVTEETLLAGVTAHKADGTSIVGTLFEDFSDEFRLYSLLQDSDGNDILDGDEDTISATTVYRKV